jgi:hypothetical protein
MVEPGIFFIYASFVRILYFVVLVLDLGLSLVWADVLYPRHQDLPSFAREDAAYWPDTHRTPLAKEGTNWIWPATVLLHAPKLGHETDNFTSPPKEGMLWILPARKIRRLRSGANPRSWVPEASMLTTRPPKPLFDPRTVQPVVSRYTDWATGPPFYQLCERKYGSVFLFLFLFLFCI